MTIPKQKGPELDAVQKLREFYYSVIRKPLSEGDKKKLKDAFGKKEKKKEDERAALGIENKGINL